MEFQNSSLPCKYFKNSAQIVFVEISKSRLLLFAMLLFISCDWRKYILHNALQSYSIYGTYYHSFPVLFTQTTDNFQIFYGHLPYATAHKKKRNQNKLLKSERRCDKVGECCDNNFALFPIDYILFQLVYSILYKKKFTRLH